MENLVISKDFWSNRRVFVTGHTGFKGGWLTLWLHQMGAHIHGFSLQKNRSNRFYERVYSKGFVGEETFDDIRNFEILNDAIVKFRPDVIFHLAAQPLVQNSFKNPVETFTTNVMGTVNLFEVIRQSSLQPVIVNVTTDKVYENNEWVWAYRENDKLGGGDPYSSSKACSELISESYLKSFFIHTETKIATTRAGNVIGGGDMSRDRLLPDYLRALQYGTELEIRNPTALRPWQYVLDPICGYILLAQKLASEEGSSYFGGWNFGPTSNPVTVLEIVQMLSEICADKRFKLDSEIRPAEAQSLVLDSSKSRMKLGWKPRLNLKQALELTFNWYNADINNHDMKLHSLNEIEVYLRHGEIH